MSEDIARPQVNSYISDSRQQLPDFPFGGRERELELLADQLGAAERGLGSVVFIAGEAGVGKTRLAQEFMKAAEARGARSLYARSASRSSLLPYSAWVECVRHFASEASVLSFFEICGDVSELMLKLLPEMTGLSAQESHLGVGTEEARHQAFEIVGGSPERYFDALTKFFFRLSRRRTLSIVVDDFQWCDETSLQMLRYIASNGLATNPILVLCLYRDTHIKSANPTLLDVTSELLGGGTPSTIIRLQRLDRGAATAILKASSGTVPLSDGLCELLYRKTGGNPLFMKETFALLRQGNPSLGDRPNNFTRLVTSDIRVPKSVKDAVKQRLTPIRPDVKGTLRIAALIGESFDLEVLRRTVSLENDARLTTVLHEAIASGLVRQAPRLSGSSQYEFVDEVIVEVLTEEVSQNRRRAYHLRIAKIKEKEYAERRNERAAELADHFRMGGDISKAFVYSLKAGDAADRVNAHKEAIINYENALRSLSRISNRDTRLTRGKVLEKLGDNKLVEGDVNGAYVNWDESAGLYETLLEHERAGLLRRKMGWYHFLERGSEKVMDEYRLSLEHFSRVPRGPGIAGLYHHMGQHLWMENKAEMARENYEKAIEIARQVGASDIEIITSLYLAFITPINEKNRVHELLRKADGITPEHVLSLSHDLSMSHDSILVHALWVTGIAFAKLMGDTKIAQRYLSQSVEIGHKTGNKRSVFWFGSWLAEWGYIPLGEWQKAKELVAEAPAWPPLELFPAIKASVFDVLGGVSLLEGDFDKAEEYLQVAYGCSPGFGSHALWDSWGLAVRLRLGRLFTIKGDYAKAERYLMELHMLQKRSSPQFLYNAERYVDCLFELVRLYVKEEKQEEASKYLSLLREFADFADTDWARGYTHWAAGLVASLAADWAEAIPALEKAVEVWRRLGWPYPLGGTYVSLATARLENGELEIANDLLDQALAVFDKLGAVRDVKEVLAAKAAAKEKGVTQLYELSRRGSESSKKIFEYLVQAFIADHQARRLSPDSSGWRSLVQVAEATRISRAGLYRARGKSKEGLRELQTLRLAEQRDFQHQRGRGGTATRVRIAYENEDVKKYVARRSKGVLRAQVQSPK